MKIYILWCFIGSLYWIYLVCLIVSLHHWYWTKKLLKRRVDQNNELYGISFQPVHYGYKNMYNKTATSTKNFNKYKLLYIVLLYTGEHTNIIILMVSSSVLLNKSDIHANQYAFYICTYWSDNQKQEIKLKSFLKYVQNHYTRCLMFFKQALKAQEIPRMFWVWL